MSNPPNTIIDPELMADFLHDSLPLLRELKVLLREFKGLEDVQVFERFGQQIDRIMGAAYTLSLTEVGDLARLGKELGYKSSQLQQIAKLLSMQSLLSQLVSALEKILTHKDPEDLTMLKKRLTEANHQLGELRTSVKN